VVFGADDLGAWLVGLLADAGRRRLTTWLLGTEQERALRQAAAAAIERTADELAESYGVPAEQLAMVVGEVFRSPLPNVALEGQQTLLQGLQAGMAWTLAVLDDRTATGTGLSSAQVLGVSGETIAHTLTGELVRQIMARGSGGGPLAPLAVQLNFDVAHLQGERLERAVADLAVLVKASAQAGKTVSWPCWLGVVPAQAECFQHRDVADAVDSAISAGGTVVVCQVLAGPGGVGKTQLAASYARAAWDAGSVDLLLWVNAGSRAGIVSAYSQAAAEVTGADAADPEKAAGRLLTWLETANQRWLIVLDDLADPADMRGLWPPSSPSGRVLVTTRRRDAALVGEGRHMVDVGLFTPGEAAVYLTAKLAAHGRADLPAEVDALAADLGYLPVALAQAAAYVADLDLDCASYRARLSDRRRSLADLVPEDSGLPDDQRSTLETTWSLSVEQADALRPAGLARPMLELASLLDPNGIPQAALTSPPALAYLTQHRGESDPGAEADAQDAGDALRSLHRLSLADIDGSDTGSRVVRVHNLVQRATRENMPAQRLEGAALAAADALLAARSNVERDTALAQALRSSGTTLVGHAGKLLWQLPTAIRIRVLRHFVPLEDYYPWRPRDWQTWRLDDQEVDGNYTRRISVCVALTVACDPAAGLAEVLPWLEDRTPLQGDEATIADVAMGILYQLRNDRPDDVWRAMIRFEHLSFSLRYQLAQADPQWLARMITAHDKVDGDDSLVVQAALDVTSNSQTADKDKDVRRAVARRYADGLPEQLRGHALTVLGRDPDRSPEILNAIVRGYLSRAAGIGAYQLVRLADEGAPDLVLPALEADLDPASDRGREALMAMADSTDAAVQAASDAALLRQLNTGTASVGQYVSRYAEQRLYSAEVAGPDLLGIVRHIIRAATGTYRYLLAYALCRVSTPLDSDQRRELLTELVASPDPETHAEVVRGLAHSATDAHHEPAAFDLLWAVLPAIEPHSRTAC
jgi:hypothetical protein